MSKIDNFSPEFRSIYQKSLRPNLDPPDSYDGDICDHGLDDVGDCVVDCGYPTEEGLEEYLQDLADDFKIDQYINSRSDNDY